MKTKFHAAKVAARVFLGSALAMNGFSISAYAADPLPTGGAFAAGSGSIATNGAAMAITQNGATGIINWDGFSIGAGHAVNINNGAGATLNRVTGADLSQINGLLTSTGSTYLINPNGIVVGAGGEIITGGAFVASTRDISNEDFLDGGAMTLSGASAGNIVNAGTIVSEHGDVVLIGRSVSNSGSISAAEGVASLAAGDHILLQTEGTGQRVFIQGANAAGDVTNEGAVTAAQAELQAANGNVYALAGNTGGIVRATGSAVRDGRILLTTSDAVVLTGELEARNADGAGGGIDVAAEDITVSGHVDVSASASGKDGGTAIIIARDEINVSGTLEANGGEGATGGFIETSGAHVSIADTTQVSTLAENGTTGTWLIDPNDLTVAASGGDITGATVSANLQNTNVTLDSDNGGAGVNGDIFINDAISWSANTLLTLDAVRNIEFGANIAASGASAGVSLIYGGDYNLNGQSISLPGASSTFSVNGQAYTLIRNLTQLAAISTSGNYALANDIDASASGALNGGAGWSHLLPVSTFSHTFAGLNHQIVGLTSTANIGLFRRIGGTGTVRDLGLVNANFSSAESQVGVLARQNTGGGTIRNVYATGSITGLDQVGGLLGYNTGTISNSWADVTVRATSPTGSAGGLVAYNGVGSITDSYALGSVNGGENVGGLVGQNDVGATIFRTFATGSVTGTSNVGGLVGFNSTPTVGAPVQPVISSSWASGRVTGTTNAGGLAGFNSGTINTSYWDSTTTGQTLNVGTNSGTITTTSAVNSTNARTEATYGNFNFSNDWILISDNNTGTGRTRPLLRSQMQTGIHNEIQLQLIDAAQSRNYTLERDIDFNGAFDVVGGNRPGIWGADGFSSLRLSGVFDGQGHTITGLLIDEISQSNKGLFSYVQGTIRNVGLVGGTVRGYGAVGGLVGYLDTSGRVERSFSSANVEGDTGGQGIGGLVGSNYGTVTEAFATGNALSGFSAGGLVGFNSASGNINNSFSTGAISGVFQGGGLVGRNDGTITSSYATGPVTAVVTHGIVRGGPGSIVTDTYFDQETGAPVSEMGTGLTTAQLQGTLPSGFSSSIWGTGTGLYPYLKWRYPNAAPVAASGIVTNGGAALAGLTVDLVTGGAAIGTAVTGTNGYFYQTFDAGTFASTGVFAYLNDQTNDGAAFSNLATANVGGLDIETNAVHIRTEDGSFTAALADFAATLLGFVDTDINFFAQTANSLSNSAGDVSLHAGNSFTLDGDVTAQQNATLRSSGTVTVSGTRTIGTTNNVNIDTNLAWTDNSASLALNGGQNIIVQANKTIGSNGTGSLTLNAGGAIQTLGNNAVNVNGFTLTGGDWSQTGTLPSFAANDFRLTGGSFLRALSGAGTSGSPYQIADIYGLQGIDSASYLVSHFALANDIDASAATTWNSNAGFKPIANDFVAQFTGSLDGAGHSVTGLIINRPTEDIVGLFGNTGVGSVLRDISITGSITGSSFVGPLAGIMEGTVEDASATATVTGNSTSIGGLIGSVNGTVRDAFATGNVTGNFASQIGGLVGTIGSGTIERSYATGTISTTGVSNVSGASAGGLVGSIQGGTVSESFATGNVSTGGNGAGGLAGDNSGTIVNSYATGNVTANDFGGGFVGIHGGGSISNAYSTGTTAVGTFNGQPLSAGGFAGQIGFGAEGTISNSFWNTTTSGRANAFGHEFAPGTVVTGRTTAEMQTLATFANAGWSIDDAGGTANVWRMYGGNSSPLLRTFLNPVTINVDNQSKIYDGAAFAGPYTTSTGTFGALGTLGDKLSTVTDAGTYAIRGLFSDQLGLDITITNGQLTIGQKALTLNASVGSKVYDGNTNATVNGSTTLTGIVSGDGVGFTFGAANFDTRNVGVGKTVTITGVALSGADAGNYTLASTATTTADITPKALAAGVAANSKVYDGTAAASGSVTSLVGVVSGDMVTANGSGTFAFVDANAGINKSVIVTGLTLSGADAGNYTLSSTGASTASITPAPLTVTANAASKTYGAVDPALTFSHAGFVGGDTSALLTGALTRATGETVAAGPYAIGQGTLSAGGNYTIAYTGANFTITPASLTVTANALSKTYGDQDPTLTFTHTGLVNGDTSAVFSGLLTRAVGETVAGGPYAINQGGLSAGGNYAITFNGANFTITPKALTVSVSANDKIYDGTTAATGTIGGLVGVVGSDSVTANGSGSFAFADANAGLNKSVNVTGLALSGADAGNYTLSSTGASTASITPAPLTVTANAGTKVYGAVDPALTFSHAGLVGGDTSALLTGALTRAAGETVAAGPYAISQGTLSAGGNYTIAYTGANFTITPASLTVTANAGSKVYGAANPTLTFAHTGLVNGDNTSVFTGALARALGETVAGGPYAINQGTLTAGGNYAIAFTGANFTITPKALTVSVSANDKVYDGSTAATGTIGGLVGVVGGDTVTANGSGTFAFADANAGVNKTVNVTGLALSGADAGNYTLSSTGASTANITPKALTVALSANDKTYDGSTNATGTVGVLAGVVGADSVTANGSGSFAFADANVGINKTVSVTGLALSGAASGNYTLASTGTTTASITPAALTITADGLSKTYGDVDPTFTFTHAGFVGGDTSVLLTGALARALGETVAGGPYAINQGSLSAGGNYTIAFTGASFTIIPATLTVTADSLTKTEGDAVDLTGRYTVQGLRLADTVTGASVTSGGAGAGAPVGVFATVASNVTGTGLSNYQIVLNNGALTVLRQSIRTVQPIQPVKNAPDGSSFVVTSVQPRTQQFGWRVEDTPVGPGEAVGGFWSLPLLIQTFNPSSSDTSLTTASSDATGSGSSRSDEDEWDMLIGTPGRLGQRGNVGVIDVRPFTVSNISFTTSN